MSLSALVNSAECGPVNPLQGLTKRFEQSNGVQQDHIRVGQPGSSRQVFRSQSTQPASSISQVAPDFIHGSSASALPTVQSASPFDLGSLNVALPRHQTPPAFQSHTPVSGWAADFIGRQNSFPALKEKPSALPSGWATDFMSNQVTKPSPLMNSLSPHESLASPALRSSPQPVMSHPMMTHGPMMAQMPQFNQPMMGWAPPSHLAQQAPISTPKDDSQVWATRFAQIEEQTQAPAPVQNTQQKELVADDLATTAGLLVESLKHETSEKFKNSAFMGLMKQLRDKEMVVDGNDMIPASETVDVKGKGRAFEEEFATSGSQSEGRRKSVHFDERYQVPWMAGDNFEEGIVAEDSQRFNTPSSQRQGIIAAQTAEWGLLQDSWDELEATSVGFQTTIAVSESTYKFQTNNPYLVGESSRHHTMHSGFSRTTYNSVLEKEAEVQRSPNDAQAWFELGVKQQENERESKAIEALTHAVSLDPSLLEGWLALAISQTNENQQEESLKAISQWVDQNERYKIASTKHGLPVIMKDDDRTLAQKTEAAIQCLLEMARITPEGEIDADIQVALAVILIAGEDYAKAQDCFKTALEVRPDDWLLYNRVGATMANNNQAEEALAYYYRALELNPNYIRARFNLGISCTNLQRHEEAASHILDALVLQEADSTDGQGKTNEPPYPGQRGVESSALWECLRTTCLRMQRHDLASICDSKDLPRFRNEFYALDDI